ncbi:M1 family metallopeptidase [Saccharomonospora viridis]|jgi:aminopeptidase N|uniref:Aminopeptidase N n=1 Tax=Saccharomonospora viridis (strain ATCC 15386 / DSM 43017 / JCM 3036 / CCUG 5913 / NBRC 12207 / NCIMB 9602 / P101) TaxID=471857 RepID=C7MQ73_SACVD|nr:M1 family metallopeptidase [Saccharomonospora viridis]ACU98496.1 aminopeptidase N [Saccharomonospora viridis DSM 43017]SFP61141.1 Peptidase family M1 [Saccharomonospora viridis]
MISRRNRVAALCGIVSIVAACTAPQDQTQRDQSGETITGRHGAAGIGDDYYPEAGNGGYDVENYAVTVRYDAESGHLTGDTTVTARAEHDLSRFNLDLRGFTVSSVEVNGEAAEFKRTGDAELVITPAEPVREGDVLETRVRYEGKPLPGERGQLGGNGWYRTASGGAFVLGEPESASYWFPVNEHPRDKATFTLTASVPEGWTAVSIGTSDEPVTQDGWTTTTWTETNPIPSYLTLFAVDKFTVETGQLPDGTPVRNVFAPGAEEARQDAEYTEEVIAFLESRFGDYPANTAGGIYLDTPTGFALETQGTPTYPPDTTVDLLVHELAHQWYGNSVSIQSWADICLSECFASYAAWLWSEEKDGTDLNANYRNQIELWRDDAAYWSRPLYDMGAGNEFDAVYSKGPLAVHALRLRIGDEAFDRLLREWPAEYANGNASWEQFEEFTERIAGEELDAFFEDWFRGTELPAKEHLHPDLYSR